MSRAELTACFELVRDTSAKDYRASAQGWDAGAKEREMRLVDLRYLLLCRAMNKEGDGGKGEGPGEEVLVGFMSFMLTYEDGLPVVYCYEIHLRDEVKGRGVGKWLMGVLEDVGRKAEAEKCMLTVFKRNTKALGFYQGLGYGVDEFSPGPRILRNGVVKEVDYLILSKELASARTGLKGAGEKQWKVG